jgi:SAM-dependent methyltransferase
MTDSATLMPAFTAHNVVLPDGRQTAPQFGPIAESGVCQASLRTLRLVFRPDEIATTSVADLGCLEGGYTAAFAQAGFQSVGIEVRDRNMQCCYFVEKALQLDNLRFVQDDVRNIGDHGPFDAVFCCGLLYHLDEPRAYLETLARYTNRVLILQTHFAEDTLPEAHKSVLSEMVEHEGNQGRWYHEFSDGASEAEVQDAVWSSWGNNKSFWIEKRHLLQNLLDVGFDCVYEQFDMVADVVGDRYWEEQGRGMFVAIKSR